MPAQKQTGHITLHTLVASESMAFGQVSAVLLQEFCKRLRSINEGLSIRFFITYPQAVDELQNGSDGVEISEVEGGVVLGQ